MFGVHVRVQPFCVAVGSGSHVMKGLNTSYRPLLGRMHLNNNNN